uniref:Uncharacterized protein n=1 Tax=Anguilla anguilla TaxID=7936 RepID=A0A0E9RWQ5_ANGAN
MSICRDDSVSRYCREPVTMFDVKKGLVTEPIRTSHLKWSGHRTSQNISSQMVWTERALQRNRSECHFYGDWQQRTVEEPIEQCHPKWPALAFPAEELSLITP